VRTAMAGWRRRLLLRGRHAGVVADPPAAVSHQRRWPASRPDAAVNADLRRFVFTSTIGTIGIHC